MDVDALQPLIYKMTHPGDPHPEADESASAPAWGRQDCMGEVRDRIYDAVIGVGGVGREAASHDLKGKILWIGIGPKPWPGGPGWRGKVMTFDHYLWLGTKGPSFLQRAPKLAQRMLGDNARVVMSLSPEEKNEVSAILQMAVDAPACHPPSAAQPEATKMSSRRGPCGCTDASPDAAG
jgi:hypothetical protein